MKLKEEVVADAKIVMIVFIVLALALTGYTVITYGLGKLNVKTDPVKYEKPKSSYTGGSGYVSEDAPVVDNSIKPPRISGEQSIAKWMHPTLVYISVIIVVVLFFGGIIIAFIAKNS